MRRSDLTLVFVIIALSQAIPACGADAAGMRAVSKFEIAQVNVYEPRSPVDEVLARAKLLSASGKFLDAYELLAQAEDAYIGIVEFDYALGRAALDARSTGQSDASPFPCARARSRPRGRLDRHRARLLGAGQLRTGACDV